MAIDEALLTLVGAGQAPPTLRFYEWRSPWVSLGTGQGASDLDPVALEARDWGVLRRASGGTAVLHQGQLGYAVILPTSHPLWNGDLASSYQRISVALALGLSCWAFHPSPRRRRRRQGSRRERRRSPRASASARSDCTSFSIDVAES